jgi:hypothetical protein
MFNWSPGTAFDDSTAQNPTIVLSDTLLTITLELTDTTMCEYRYDTMSLLVAPTVPTWLSPDTMICLGDTVQLYGYGGASYEWLNPAHLSSSTGAAVLAWPNDDYVYDVRLTDIYGCSTTDSVGVDVWHPVYAPIAGDTAICPGETTVLAFDNNLSGFIWSDGSVDTNAITVDTAGIAWCRAVDSMGCIVRDSVAVVYDVIRDSMLVAACDSVLFGGLVYYNTTALSDTGIAQSGCDSIMWVDVVVHQLADTVLSVVACETYTLNNQTYTSSGVYQQSLTSAVGCDSLLILDLTVLPPSTSSISVSDCYDVVVNGHTYWISGTYQQVLTAQSGCDSILTIHVDIKSTSEIIDMTACDAFELNGEVYTASGQYVQILTNAAGCDSTLVLILTINTVNTTVFQTGHLLIAVPVIATFQWINCAGDIPIAGATSQTFLATEDGSYAVIITENGCTDTSDCYEVVGTALTELSDRVSVYPNPTTGSLTIQFAGAGYAGIVVRDVSGRQVEVPLLPRSDDVELVLPSRAGLYLVTVHLEDGTRCRFKVQKQ